MTAAKELPRYVVVFETSTGHSAVPYYSFESLVEFLDSKTPQTFVIYVLTGDNAVYGAMDGDEEFIDPAFRRRVSEFRDMTGHSR